MTAELMETTDRPFREAGFREASVEIERRRDGTLILKAGPPLPPTHACTTDWLEHWANIRPASPMLVQRNREGAWESWSVGEVWRGVRAIATALLSHGAGQSAPLAILSENSTAQALITWGALYAGVPVGPVSPAYSLMGSSGSYKRLTDAVSIVKPHLVFVEDAEQRTTVIEVSDWRPLLWFGYLPIKFANPIMLGFAGSGGMRMETRDASTAVLSC